VAHDYESVLVAVEAGEKSTPACSAIGVSQGMFYAWLRNDVDRVRRYNATRPAGRQIPAVPIDRKKYSRDRDLNSDQPRHDTMTILSSFLSLVSQ